MTEGTVHVPMPTPATAKAPRTSVQYQLDQHVARRSKETPAISTLVGPLGVAKRAWEGWASARGLRTAFCGGASPLHWLIRWMDSVFQSCDLVGSAEVYLAARVNASPSSFLAKVRWKTLPELNLLLSRAGLDAPSAAIERITATILTTIVERQTFSLEDLVSAVRSMPGTIDESVLSTFQAVFQLGSNQPFPGLFITPSSGTTFEGSIETLFRPLVRLATAVPRLPIGLAITKSFFDLHVRAARTSFVQAAVSENTVLLPVWTAGEIEERMAPCVRERRPGFSRAAEWLSKHGASETTVESLAEVATTEATLTVNHSVDKPWEQGESAHSAYERFLFNLLEDDPELAGLFELNGCPGFKFGGKSAEVDLLSESRNLAVEIDGYYHFLKPESYRRDRRKDWKLQRHGYFVLRFLADDVVSRMQDVLTTIRDAARHAVRTSTNSPDRREELQDEQCRLE